MKSAITRVKSGVAAVRKSLGGAVDVVRRIGAVIGPYWVENGIYSALGILAVIIATCYSFERLQFVADQVDAITAWVTAALALGYGQFFWHYCLPALAVSGVAFYIGRKYWPKNANANGLLLLFLLLLLMLSVNTLNVILNFANGAITNAMNHHDAAGFSLMVMRLLVCFVIGTFVVVLYSYVKSRLHMSWRAWMTAYVLDKYFRNRNYYRINHDPNIDNPDERIQQDIDGVVSGALSLLLTILGSIITFYTFIGILKEVDPTGQLAWIAYAWSAGFTLLAIGVGKKLVGLNFGQQRREADFRYNLIHVRKNVESIAFYHAEDREAKQLGVRFDELLKNWSQLIGWTRNLGFIQTASDYFTVAIPFLILGPLYFAGKVEMGTIGQSAMAFGQVLSALTLVVTEFGGISLFLARVNRLSAFTRALDAPEHPAGAKLIKTRVEPRLAFEGVTVMTPGYERTLVRDLTVNVDAGSPLLVMGPSGSGKSSLLRAVAALWASGDGVIVRPDLDEVMFLPQVPYMLLGSLRDQLLYRSRTPITDAELDEVLKTVNLPDLKARVGGFDAVLPWSDVLSPGEQQRLAFARLLVARPQFAILDEATSALDEVNEEHLYEMLHASGTTYISVGHRPSLQRYHRNVLKLTGDGGWTVSAIEQH